MEMESLDGINLFFLVLQERPTEAPCSTIEKKGYDGELAVDSRNELLTSTWLRMPFNFAQNDSIAIYNGIMVL
jgi:hypothetical protein